MENKEIYEKLQNGVTQQQIADELGISRQAVCSRMEHYKAKANGKRGHLLQIEDIIYKGIYEHFKANEDESLHSFTNKIHNNYPGLATKIHSFITGEHNSFFNLEQIKKICEVVGKPFEEVFAERKG